MEIGEGIVIELPNKDRYLIEKQPGSYRLMKNDKILCFFWDNDPLSRQLFKTAFEEILNIIQRLVKLDG